MKRFFLLSLAFGLVAGTADAHPRGHGNRAARSPSYGRTYGHRPYARHGVRSYGYVGYANPWSAAWVPTARPGWSWVGGRYDRYGYWIPGAWRPLAARSGYVWVSGFWDGGAWIDGYWRPASRYGYRWVDGMYDRGVWVEGYWVDVRRGGAWYEDELREQLREAEEENAELREQLEEERREDAREERRGDGRDDRNGRNGRDDRREGNGRGGRHHDPE